MKERGLESKQLLFYIILGHHASASHFRLNSCIQKIDSHCKLDLHKGHDHKFSCFIPGQVDHVSS